MLVSVVVPAFNEEKYIPRCLHALTQQERDGFDVELIVVDANSTDRTREIARAYGARVIMQYGRGIAEGRQIGFEASRGEIIASTDADSEPPRDWLVRLVAELQRVPQVVGVYGPIRLYDGKAYEDLFSQYVAGSYLWLDAVIGKPIFSGQNFAVRREVWKSIGGFDRHWVSAEDVNLSLKLARVGKVKFNWDVQVYTSARRTREGYTKVFGHTIAIYLRVTWLKMPSLPFEDIR